MNKLYDHPGAFEAEITIFTEQEGGRKTPPKNGIRWDLTYAENNPEGRMFMIWPEFIDENGDSIDTGVPLTGKLKARIHIVVKEMMEFHSGRISVGTKFFSMEGPKKVAKGVVTKVTGFSKINEA